jgi:hypothetical protein
MIFPSWQETFLALQAAETLEDLFQRFHEDRDDKVVITALLLCTDHRWRKASHRLIGRLAESTSLSDGDLDELAAIFLEPDMAIEIDDGRTLQRQIWPPLRRWAAARQVSNDPSVWTALLEFAHTLPGSDGDAIATGVMDEADSVLIDHRAQVLDRGLGWGSGIVRLAALPCYAQFAGDEAAAARAAADPSATVRRWTPTPAVSDIRQPPVNPQTSIDDHKAGHRPQPSLFETLGPEE